MSGAAPSTPSETISQAPATFGVPGLNDPDDRHLCTDHMAADLKRRSGRGTRFKLAIRELVANYGTLFDEGRYGELSIKPIKLHHKMLEWIAAAYLRRHVQSREFGIVTNNCWGYPAYQALRIPYLTPFVGLFIPPDCYIRLVWNFRQAMRSPLNFKRRSKYDSLNAFRDSRQTAYPIGSIADDIELHFLHYESERDAHEKWMRRSARLPPEDERLFFKFCDSDSPSDGALETFDRLPVRHKVCFVGKRRAWLQSAVTIPSRTGRIPGNGALLRVGHRHFDLADWLNGGDGTRRGYYRALSQLWS